MRTPIRVLFAMLAVALLGGAFAASAAATPTYTLSGIEIDATPATFVGVVSGGGLWQAVVTYTTLDKQGVTPFTGQVLIRPSGGTVLQGTVTDGELVAETPVYRLFTCTQRFHFANTPIVFSSGAATAAGVLTHYGTYDRTLPPAARTCNAFGASASVTVTFTSG